MSTLSIELPPEEQERLKEVAAREGATAEQITTAAVRARLDGEAAWRTEVEAGIAEMDAGKGVSLEEFERDMDAFMAALRSKRANA